MDTLSGWPAPVDPPGWGPPPRPETQPDSWFGHFLRYLAVSSLLTLSMLFVIGFFWQGHILNRTGYRKRDLLLLFVPIAAHIVAIKSLWRYTARDIYWSPRPEPERVPDLLRGWQRPAAIAGGWVALPLMLVGLFALGYAERHWSDAELDELADDFVAMGYDRFTAECMVDQIIIDFPDEWDLEDASSIQVAASVQRAIDLCAP
jgi:hypothetical protein